MFVARGKFAGILGGLLLGFSGPVYAQPLAPELCLSCHGVEGLEKARAGKKVSLHVDGQSFSLSVHGPLGCAACHGDVSQLPHSPELKRVNCAACHGAQTEAYAQSVHGRARTKGIGEAASCADCHGNIHVLRPRTNLSSPVKRENVARTCASCHANAELAEKFRIPVVRPVEAYLQSAHARALAEGKRGAVCSDCHGSHAIAPSTDPLSMISRTSVPATCGKCHQSVATQFQQSIHAEAAARGVREAPVCNDCHGEHRILARTEPHSPVFAANIPGETCGRCHGSARLTEKFGLAPDQVRSFRDSFHGLALRAGQITAANCASCHGVHDITPSSDPRSHVHPANVPATCGKCHPGAGARFVLGPVHVVPASTTIPILYWIRFIYLWVISLTVFFMLAHNALDLSRKARRRELFPSVPLTERPERMSRELRWQHGLVMFSFPILVYTGFALTYPESWWAAPLLVWESQLGLRGALHRVASFVLLASLFWHLIHLGVSRELRRKLRELRPTAQDCRDLIAVLRFNLGLTPIRPGFGKFSYVEKIEYWAFIWGMVIMTASGLLLWFENFTLRYLPKIATDIATAIHFYEAALATLAIVVWHFYWVIFDPDVYPMDSSWWHGRPPAARSAERNRGAQSADAAKTTEESNSRGQS